MGLCIYPGYDFFLEVKPEDKCGINIQRQADDTARHEPSHQCRLFGLYEGI